VADTPQFLTLAGNRDRSERYVRPLLEPEPLFLVEDGKVIERNLRKERMTSERSPARRASSRSTRWRR
jgi:hypothetical protein